MNSVATGGSLYVNRFKKKIFPLTKQRKIGGYTDTPCLDPRRQVLPQVHLLLSSRI